jgi:uncharacterized protein YlxW (UPF0749 family)
MSFEKRMMETLYRKYGEAVQASFNHELNFFAEQAKNAELQEKIEELNKKIESLSKKRKKDSPEITIDSESY